MPIAATFAALSDPTRIAVIDLLSKEPCRAGELAASLDTTPAAMSRHLRVLRRSGLIAEEGIAEDARVRIYRLKQEPFAQLSGWLAEVEEFWGGQLTSFQKHVSGRRKK